MKRYLLIPLLAAASTLHASDALAGYTGPGATAVATTVAQARQQRDDHTVLLVGHLVAKVADERYRFKDATGEIEVEIDDEDMPRAPIGATTPVELLGKVDTHRFKATDIEVKRVQVLPAR
ncbi:hypothetical protein D3C87_360800 [compost metagenome]